MKNAAPLRLPDFIAVGPPRTATTWLDEALTGHVGLPRGIKETQFFSIYFDLGMEWYAAHFRDCPPQLPVGEVATTYFDSPIARERIRQYIPHCKVICTLRDPVRRLYSHYRQLRREGFLGAVTLEQGIEANRRWSGPGNMFSISQYTLNVSAWQEQMGKDQVLVMFHDDLAANPQKFIDDITAFIGIARIDLTRSPVGAVKVNEMNQAPKNPKLAARAREFREWLRRRKIYSISEGCEPLWNFCFGRGEKFDPLDPKVERQLREFFCPEVEALEKLVNRDLSSWKETPRR